MNRGLYIIWTSHSTRYMPAWSRQCFWYPSLYNKDTDVHTYPGVMKDSKYQYIRTIGTNYRKFAVWSLSYIIYIYIYIKTIPHLFHHMNIQNRLANRDKQYTGKYHCQHAGYDIVATEYPTYTFWHYEYRMTCVRTFQTILISACLYRTWEI